MTGNPLFWLVFLAVAIAMEFWAMLLHGQLWHGRWWPAHRSHHVPHTGWLEVNDLFALLHASIAIALIVGGLERRLGALSAVCVAAGCGMTLFGLAYFVVHDGLIHGRLPVAFLARASWLRRVRNAHQVHHRHNAAPYGLFLGPWELRRRMAPSGNAGRNRRAHPH